ncbi:major facilitator superfamily transporter [Epithele typhae]|uniref:major facilitator superfamily transporter n=1 Tax=Epithele typhae TaxID=378194 RepID=UPI00200754C6|nr:major facilitator superfamily transporter [Epithele typhae]KAH9935200.1 major facilitator superfamily transporter [Epithele typhae]
MEDLDETAPLLAKVRTEARAPAEPKKKTPLPMVQIGIVMLLHISEPMSGLTIFPFINQLISELDITGGDPKKVGYYAGMISVIGELTDSTNMAQGFACLPISWSLGATIAPMIGGILARPQDQWPNLFSHPFWGKYPYFLPCAVASAFTAVCFIITAVFLREVTFPNVVDEDAPPPLRSLLIRPVLLSVAHYGALALIDVGWFALFPLFLSTPIAWGPWNGSADDRHHPRHRRRARRLFQAFCFAPAVDRWGPKTIFRTGIVAFVPCSRSSPRSAPSRLTMLCIMDMSFGTVFMYVHSSAPNSRSLGAVNGIAQVLASVARAIGPAASTSLFASSLEHNWLGGNLGYKTWERAEEHEE